MPAQPPLCAHSPPPRAAAHHPLAFRSHNYNVALILLDKAAAARPLLNMPLSECRFLLPPSSLNSHPRPRPFPSYFL